MFYLDKRKIVPIIIQTVLNVIPLAGILLLDWRLARLLFFYLLEGVAMIIYGIVRILVAPHKEEEDLVIPVEEGVDTMPVPQRFEKPVLVGLFVLYAVVFTAAYGVLALVFGGLSELPYIRSGGVHINWPFWLLMAAIWLVGQGVIFLTETLGNPEIKIQGDKHEINVTLYRMVMKFVVVLVAAVAIQAFFRPFKFQAATILVKIALDISLILGSRRI